MRPLWRCSPTKWTRWGWCGCSGRMESEGVQYIPRNILMYSVWEIPLLYRLLQKGRKTLLFWSTFLCRGRICIVPNLKHTCVSSAGEGLSRPLANGRDANDVASRPASDLKLTPVQVGAFGMQLTTFMIHRFRLSAN